jgi:drug/metabolite transporter (DMT)-like permease
VNRGPSLIIFAAFLWSLDGLLRRSLYSLDSSVVVFWEHVLGLLLLAPLLVRTLSEFKGLSRKTWFAIGWVSLLSGVLGTFFYTKALAQVSFIQFSVVVLLQQLQPIFEISMAVLILRETVSRDFVAWAALAMGGAYLVSFPNLTVNFASEQNTVIAALLAVGAAFSWGSSTVFSKYGLERLSYRAMTGVRFAVTSLLALPFVFLVGEPSQLGAVDPSQWLRLLVIALSTGMVAMVIYYAGLKRTPVRVAAIAELFWPVSAIGLDYFFFHRTLTVTQWIGAILLLLAITQVSLRRRREQAALAA